MATAKQRRLVKRTAAPPGGSPGTPLTMSSDNGDMELHYAKELTVLKHIQRTPTDSRIRSLAADWEPSKEGVIFVAKITDGEHIGVLHPYDGGTRVVAQQTYGDPDHVFLCWVKEMTEQEAADAFLTFNMLSRRPSAYSQYVVALEADHAWAHAILDATNAVGVTVAEHSTSNKLSAVKACERIVTNRHHDDFTEAKEHLIEVFNVTMTAYPGQPEAYDADLIQAISRILLDNETVPVDMRRMQSTIASRPMSNWRYAAMAAVKMSRR